MVKDHSHELVVAGLGPYVSECTQRLK